MFKSHSLLFLILVSTSVFSKQPIDDPRTVIFDTPCDTLVLVYAHEFNESMTVDELIEEKNNSIQLTSIAKSNCYNKGKSKTKGSRSPGIQASQGHGPNVEDEPLPPTSQPGWILIDSNHHTTTVQASCVILDTSTYVWQLVDGNGNVIRFDVTVNTVEITILNCEASVPYVARNIS